MLMDKINDYYLKKKKHVRCKTFVHCIYKNVIRNLITNKKKTNRENERVDDITLWYPYTDVIGIDVHTQGGVGRTGRRSFCFPFNQSPLRPQQVG